MRSAATPAAVIASVVTLTAVISAVLLIAPVVVGALISHHSFSARQAGWTISIELGAMSLAALPALWWLPVAPWRRVVTAALFVMIIGNLACAFVSGFAALAALRFVTGVAGGSIMVVCMALIGATRDKERNFGWWTVGQLALGAAGLATLPRILPSVGLQGLYFGLAALLALCLVAVRWLPKRAAPSGAAQPVDPRRQPAVSSGLAPTALLALAGILVFYAALSGVWTFIERIGAAANLPAERIGDDLTIASLFGVAGCISAVLLATRLGRRLPVIAGYALMIGSITALAGTPGGWRYTWAACGFKYAWTFTLPYILASTAEHDGSGRLMALANLMIGCGLAVGPALVAAMLAPQPDYGVSLLLGGAGAVISLSLLLLSLRGVQTPTPSR